MTSVNCPDRLARPFSGPAIFVGGIWFVMFAGALSLLGRFAVNVPYAEDGMLIPYVTGSEHLDMKFLWSQYSSHIMPLPKLVLFLLVRFTGDFRTSMYVSVLMCAAAALALAYAAKSLRGRFDYTDAFFAIGLLHLGHFESFLIGFAIQEVMSTCLLVIVLLTILRSEPSLSRGQSLLVGSCLVILPTTGTAGFLLVPPLAIWLAYCAWVNWRVGGRGAYSTALLQLALVLAALASMTPYYFSPPHGVPWQHGPANAAEKGFAILSVLMQVFTLGFGLSATTPWLPILKGERAFFLVGSFVLVLALVALVILFVRRLPPAERLRRSGLFFYLLANLLVLAGIAFGRSGLSKSVGLASPRYSLYAVPLLWGIYFTWQLYGSRLGGRLVPIGLFVFMCAMFSLNMHLGYVRAEVRHAILKAVERNMSRAEVSDSAIANFYLRLTGNHWVAYKGCLKGRGDEQFIQDEMANMVSMLRQAGIPRHKQHHPRPDNPELLHALSPK